MSEKPSKGAPKLEVIDGGNNPMSHPPKEGHLVMVIDNGDDVPLSNEALADEAFPFRTSLLNYLSTNNIQPEELLCRSRVNSHVASFRESSNAKLSNEIRGFYENGFVEEEEYAMAILKVVALRLKLDQLLDFNVANKP